MPPFPYYLFQHCGRYRVYTYIGKIDIVSAFVHKNEIFKYYRKRRKRRELTAPRRGLSLTKYFFSAKLDAEMGMREYKMEEYLRLFKALSDKTRLRIINLLLRSGQELCVCEIVDSINESQYNVSKHLKELKYAGLIEEKKVGRWVSYGLASTTDTKDEFKDILFRAIASIPEDLIAKDMELLKARLLLRKEGKCIIGLQSKQWEIVLDGLKKERRI